MIPLIPVLIIGGVIWISLKHSSPPTEIQRVPLLKSSTRSNSEKPKIKPRNSIFRGFIHWDEKYQEFMQSHLDVKILGKTWHQQMLELNGGQFQELSPQEKLINRRLLLGSVGLGVIALGYTTGLAVTPLILAIAIFNFIPLIKESWRIVVEERRFSLLHLLAMYFAYMWGRGYYLIGTLGALLFNLNSKVLLLSETATRRSLVQLMKEQPQKVFILLDGLEVEISFEQLQVGDVLVLQAGQQVPIDGTILHGSATLDQHSLTGESQPVEKIVGDPLWASTMILSGRIQVQVEKTGTETTAAKISSILQHTVDVQKTSMADQYRFLESSKWIMLVGSGLGWFLAGPTTAIALLGCNFLTTMIPLKLITLLNGLKLSAEQGILIKDGRVFEQLPKITTIVFDKTGTLTSAHPQVTAIYCEEGYGEAQILTFAVTAEQRQNHPIAQAILAMAKQQDLKLPELEDTEYQLGLGLTVQVEGQLIYVGSERFLKKENILLSSSLQQAQHLAQEEGDSLIFVAVNDKAIGGLKLSATLRPEVQKMVNWFKQQGLSLYILSGDQEAPTRKLAKQLDVTGYFANTLPEQKAERIKELQSQGQQVCFIGDGINDAIALHQAEVSISLRGATTVATDMAQIVLMNDQLLQLTLLWQVAQNFQDNITHNTNRSLQFSWIAATGVIFLPFKFWIVEAMWGSQIFTGVYLANQPLLTTDSLEKISESEG